MTATVSLGDLAPSSSDAVRIPLSALVTAPGAGSGSTQEAAQLAVFVVAGGRVTRRAVNTGDLVGSSIIVKAGLKEGDEVVTSGASLLYDGAPVEVIRDESAAQ